MNNATVSDIFKECKRLMSIADRYGEQRTDTYQLVSKLRREMELLRHNYQDIEEYDVDKVDRLKRACENTAIMLEYSLAADDFDLNLRYRIRSEVARVKRDLSGLLKVTSNDEPFKKVELLSKYYTIDKMFQDTVHLDFSFTKSEIDRLMDIKKYAEECRLE